jgi:predicted site-specific integrase-resolvase
MNKPTSSPTKLLSGRAAADRLDISVKTLNRWRRQGRISALQLPDGTFRYCLTEIVNALGGMNRGERR